MSAANKSLNIVSLYVLHHLDLKYRILNHRQRNIQPIINIIKATGPPIMQGITVSLGSENDTKHGAVVFIITLTTFAGNVSASFTWRCHRRRRFSRRGTPNGACFNGACTTGRSSRGPRCSPRRGGGTRGRSLRTRSLASDASWGCMREMVRALREKDSLRVSF